MKITCLKKQKIKSKKVKKKRKKKRKATCRLRARPVLGSERRNLNRSLIPSIVFPYTLSQNIFMLKKIHCLILSWVMDWDEESNDFYVFH